MSNYTYRTCRWCGQTYQCNSSSPQQYNCCGERCLLEWAKVNVDQYFIEEGAIREKQKRLEASVKSFKNSCSSVLFFCVVLAAIAVLYTNLTWKSTSSSDTEKVRIGNKLNQKSDDYYCRYCRRKPSQTDGRTCYKARDPYLHVWVKQ
jgi:hypothetical protein